MTQSDADNTDSDAGRMRLLGSDAGGGGKRMPGSNASPSYADPLARVQPRSITSEEEADAIQARIDALIDQETLSPPEQHLLSLLGDLVLAWEDGRYDLPQPSVAESINALLEAHDMQQADLIGPVFANEATASAVFNGQRGLTRSQQERLARFFHVSPAVFDSGIARRAGVRAG